MRTRRLHVWLVLAVALTTLAGCGASVRATTAIATAIPTITPGPRPTFAYQPNPGFADPATLGWVKASAPLPDVIAIAPTVPGTLYTCTGAGGRSAVSTQGPITLSVSTDGGASWQTKNTGIPLARCLGLAVSPESSQAVALYAGTCRSDCGKGYERLYLSLDGGAHWTQVSPSSDSDFSAVFGWAGSAFFANTAPDGTPASATQFLAASRDGVHFAWTSLPAAPSQLFSAESTLFAVTGSSAPCTLTVGSCSDLYRSTDFGASWTRVTPAYQGNDVRPAALVPGGTTLIGFEARAFSGPNTYPMLRSYDSGASWRPLPGLPGGLQASTDTPLVTPDGTIFATFCCGAPGAATVSGIYKLAPGAAAWTLVSPAVPAQVRLMAVSWDVSGQPATLWGLGDVFPNTSAGITDLWSHSA